MSRIHAFQSLCSCNAKLLNIIGTAKFLFYKLHFATTQT